MDNAKKGVMDFLHKHGKHDTTVHENMAPAVTNETVNKHHHDNVVTAVDKEVHQDHYHTTVQPVHDNQTLPEQHHYKTGPVEHRKFEHGNDQEVEQRLRTEREKFKDTTTQGETKHTSHSAEPVVGEHVHHHVHENIQPVVNRQTVEPHVVHTTVPIHEVHHSAAQHHNTSALPPMHMSDFKKQGGSLGGREQRTDFFEGEPRSMEGHTPHRPGDASSEFRHTGHTTRHANNNDQGHGLGGGAATAGLAGGAAAGAAATHHHHKTGDHHNASTGRRGSSSSSSSSDVDRPKHSKTAGIAGTGLGSGTHTSGTHGGLGSGTHTTGSHGGLGSGTQRGLDSSTTGTTGSHIPGQSNTTGSHIPGQSSTTGSHIPGQSSTTGSHIPGQSSTTGSHIPGSSTTTGNHLPGNSATGNTSSGLTGNHGTHGNSTSGTTGNHGTSASTGTTSSTTTGSAKKPSIIDRLNPLKDTDGDGKKGIMD